MIAELVVVAIVLAGVAAPHALPLERVAPVPAAALWSAALLLRAVVAAGAAFFLLVYLPRTELFDAVARWCIHELVPFFAAHLGLSGHPIAHAAAVLPALTVAASLMWLAVGLARAWVALRRQLRGAIGEGPAGSAVIEGQDVVVAIAAVGRPRIVLSAGALEAFDAGELRASLAHERGHLRRCHRPWLMAAALLAATGRLIPGTRRAERALLFHLERDADEFAVRETRDPLALASAICKAAQSQALSLASASLAGRGGLVERLEILVDGGAARSAWLGRAAAATAALLVLIAIGLAASIPSWAVDPPEYAGTSVAERCHH